MKNITVTLRPAKKQDLDNINRVIEAAIMTWNLPERVKRLSLSSYRYTMFDYEHLDMLVAEDHQQNIIGIAAWEQANTKDTPENLSALLLHGIYVDPVHHHEGIGRKLFQELKQTAKQQHYDGILVKAQSGAEGFFTAMGMQLLPVDNPERQYANRYWLKLEKDEKDC